MKLASVEGIVTMLLAIAGMVAIAVVAWRAVQRQERDDPAFEAKLKADDERAAAGLQADAQAREASRQPDGKR
jgi:hypothetical protein